MPRLGAVATAAAMVLPRRGSEPIRVHVAEGVDAQVREEGAQGMLIGTPGNGERPLGHVSSSYFSATLGTSIALALISGGRARTGQTLQVPMPDGPIAVQVTSPIFYDPTGAKINA